AAGPHPTRYRLHGKVLPDNAFAQNSGKLEKPREESAILMLRGVAGILEKHHQVQILDEAIETAVSLSHRYIPARQLPDKA
ncbi:hypothetical protein ACC740_38180, partial [Rhizobium ruizarguesonis]